MQMIAGNDVHSVSLNLFVGNIGIFWQTEFNFLKNKLLHLHYMLEITPVATYEELTA